MQKAKKYDWKDSNMALFGSDTEKQVKKESAMTEKAWHGAGEKPGVQVWRIVKFKITHWPKEDYGEFYNGDSYIVLNTYKEPGEDKLKHDVHFWIGKFSTQDEYGTAAYKTVELDTFLNDEPIQHREVQNNETSLFKSYFKDSFTILEGGADTGFRRVVGTPEAVNRLFHFHGDRKGVVVKEIIRKKSNLQSSDCYILDQGLQIYVWFGKDCNKDEKFKVAQYLQELKSKRGGKPSVETLEEEETPPNHKFFSFLDQDADDDDDIDPTYDAQKAVKYLYRLSNASGELDFSLVKEGTIQKDDFKSEDVFILDTQRDCFVWVGNATDEQERKNGLTYAHNYLMKTDHPTIPVTVLREGQRSTLFNAALDG